MCLTSLFLPLSPFLLPFIPFLLPFSSLLLLPLPLSLFSLPSLLFPFFFAFLLPILLLPSPTLPPPLLHSHLASYAPTYLPRLQSKAGLGNGLDSLVKLDLSRQAVHHLVQGLRHGLCSLCQTQLLVWCSRVFYSCLCLRDECNTLVHHLMS